MAFVLLDLLALPENVINSTLHPGCDKKNGGYDHDIRYTPGFEPDTAPEFPGSDPLVDKGDEVFLPENESVGGFFSQQAWFQKERLFPAFTAKAQRTAKRMCWCVEVSRLAWSLQKQIPDIFLYRVGGQRVIHQAFDDDVQVNTCDLFLSCV